MIRECKVATITESRHGIADWIIYALVFVSMASTAYAGYSAAQQSRARLRQSKVQSQIAQNNMELAQLKRDTEERKTALAVSAQQDRYKKMRGMAAVNLAKNGWSLDQEGSPVIIMSELASQNELDKLAIQAAGDETQQKILAQQISYTYDSVLASMRGSEASKGISRAGVGTVLNVAATGAKAAFALDGGSDGGSSDASFYEA